MKNQNQVLARQLGPNLPGRQALASAVGAIGYCTAALTLPQMLFPLGVMGSYLTVRCALNVRRAVEQIRFDEAMMGNHRRWVTYDEFEKMAVQSESVAARWLGYGFSWTAEHCQAVTEFLKRPWQELYRETVARTAKRRFLRKHFKDCFMHPVQVWSSLQTMKDVIATQPGYAWVHAMGKEKPLIVGRTLKVPPKRTLI